MFQALARSRIRTAQQYNVQCPETPISNEQALSHRLKIIVMRHQNIARLNAMRGDHGIFRILNQYVLETRRLESNAIQVFRDLLSDVVVEEKRWIRQSYAAFARFSSCLRAALISSGWRSGYSRIICCVE